ncbi:carbohydrate esterase family 3 [Fusarium acutatum]|uniref:Carbohydrate esterase family 3 n=1 Tax=Fusarium acutatum TaxID=78861 RepID=A0A8H4JXQ0_9HYPO|nr:carbohydrate esterase family 3 [Fusarium acutatum]
MRLFRSGQAAISIISVILLYPYPLIASHSDAILPYGVRHAPGVIHPDNRGHELHESGSGIDLDHNEIDNLTFTVEQSSELDRRAAKDFYLRVMPLGASITQGYKSSDGNGYRKWLRAQLRFRGWKVSMWLDQREMALWQTRTMKVILAGQLTPCMALGQKASG